jgi:NADPH:quinone reductase-like Zn-dependent oxidoreductase
MRAVELVAYSGASALRLVSRPTPQPQPGEVLVRVAAAPVNPSDLMFIRGLYGIRKPLPCVPGFEGSGTVVATGPGLYGFALRGRRVACGSQSGDGTWAEYVVVSAWNCMPLLPHISFAGGATLLVNPLTAWALVDTARRSKTGALVQTAAASQVGRMILGIARRCGLPVISIVRRAEQAALLRSFGAEHVLDSSQPEFDQRLAELCARLGATLAADAVGGEMTGRLLAAMPRGAQVLVYGALEEAACQLDPGQLIFNHKRVRGFWLADWLVERSRLEVLFASVMLQTRFASIVRSTVQARVPLIEVRRGLERYEQAMTAGKVLLVPHRAG